MSLTTSSLRDSTTLFEIAPNKFISIQKLKDWLPTVELALWFAKVYKLDYTKVSSLLDTLFHSTVIEALRDGNHSLELQDYLVDTVPDEVWEQVKPDFVDTPPPGEVLPQLWAAAEIEVAKSIQEVGDKLASTLEKLPSKEGRMLFQTMARMNANRPTLGVHKAVIQHQAVPDVLVILDDSGSMTEPTIREIIDDVVALSWKANAHLALVSNTARHWEPGTYNVDDVLKQAEYGGTYYETLAPLFERSWGTVVSIADYDSSRDARRVLGQCKGRIGTVLDISLVNQPTFLSECVGQLADEVRPLMVARGILRGFYW